MKFIVYKVTFPNDKIYIGITSKSLEQRKRKHFSKVKNNSKFKFHNALRKYNGKEIWEEFCFALTWKYACELEMILIEQFNSFINGYNSTLGGDGTIGRKVSKKTKELLREMNLGKKNPNFNRKHTHESKLKSAASNGTKPFKVIDHTNKLVGIWYIKKQCADELKLNKQYISFCLKNKKGFKSHKGYTFSYVGDSHA